MRTQQDSTASNSPNEAPGLIRRGVAGILDGPLALLPADAALERDSAALLDPAGDPPRKVRLRASSSLKREVDQVAAFELDLRRAESASAPGPVSAGVAHELRGWLNSIVLQVEVIKQGFRSGGCDLVSDSETDALERHLHRLGLALKQILGEGAPITPREEALGSAS